MTCLTLLNAVEITDVPYACWKFNGTQETTRQLTIKRKENQIYEGGPISTWPTKEKRKFWKSGDLFLNVVSF